MARAFTRTDLLVLLAVIAVLFVLPGLVDIGAPKAEARALRASCQNNLKQLGLSFRTWAEDFDNHFPMSIPMGKGGTLEFAAGSNLFRHFQVMKDQINNPKIIVCPADTNHQPATNFTSLSNSNLSYFIGLDADESRRASILCGDLNLVTNGVPVGPGLVNVSSQDILTWSAQIHHNAGNILLSDGSAIQADNQTLQQLFQATGTNVTRLGVP